MKHPFRPLLAGVAATALMTTAACGVESGRTSTAGGGGDGGGGKASCPWKADPKVATKATLAYQASPTGDLIVKDKGWLEACMPNAKITWAKFASGADVIQAFGSKSADLGLIGSSPTTIALSKPLDLPIKVVWIQEVIGTAEALVSHDSSIKTVADLRGKKVAVPFSSTAHFSLLQALDGAGLTEGKDVTLVNLAPDAILAAWQSGQVDAAWIWNPVQSEIAKSGKVIFSSADTAKAGKPTFDLSAATSDFVDQNAAFMKQWATAQNKAVALIGADPKDAATSIGIQMGAQPADVAGQFSGYKFLTAKEQLTPDYLGGKLGKDLLTTAGFLLDQGSIEGANPAATYDSAVDVAPARAAQ